MPQEGHLQQDVQGLQKLLPMASKIAGNLEHTKSQCFVLFKWVSCMPCDLQVNEAVLKTAPCPVQPPLLLSPDSAVVEPGWTAAIFGAPFFPCLRLCRHSSLCLPYHAHLENFCSLFESAFQSFILYEATQLLRQSECLCPWSFLSSSLHLSVLRLSTLFTHLTHSQSEPCTGKDNIRIPGTQGIK